MKRRIIYEYNLIHVYLPKLMLVVILSEFLYIMLLIMTYNVFSRFLLYPYLWGPY